MSISSSRARAAEVALGFVLALAPFEAREPTLAMAGVRFTVLEMTAAVASLALAAACGPALLAVLRRPPIALVAIWTYAAAHVLSAVVTSEGGAESARFALRMASAALWATVVASAPAEARRAGLRGLAAGALVMAALVIAEALGLEGIDDVLRPFRESAFVVGGTRRPTGPTEYPNLAAFFLAAGLVATGACARAPSAAAALGGALSLALVATYSRAGLAAAAAGLFAMIVAPRMRKAPSRSAAMAALVVLASVTAAFTGIPTFRLRMTGEPMQVWYRARYAPAPRDLVLAPGERRTVNVAVTNAGAETWRGDGSLLLGHHWYTRDGRPVRLEKIGPSLRQDVPPGGSAAFDASIEAPASEGAYVLAWDLIHVHAGWFTHRGVEPGTASVRVTTRENDREPIPPHPRLSVTPAPAWGEWRPGRKELWSLAAAMWRDHPWLGAGPDTFRRLHGRYAGRSRWDTRVYANNALLEAAATTGLLGALALAAVYGCTLRSALRAGDAAAAQGRVARAGAVGLAAMLALHALADYVLAFTGAYLVSAFAVGLACPSRTTAADG